MRKRQQKKLRKRGEAASEPQQPQDTSRERRVMEQKAASVEGSGQGRRTERPEIEEARPELRGEEAGETDEGPSEATDESRHAHTREGYDEVEEAGMESFPASDPPAFTPER